MVLDRKAFLKAVQKKSENVAIGDNSVTCSELSFSEINAVRESELIKDTTGEFDGYKFIALLMAYSIRDGKGERLFLDTEIDIIMGLPRAEYLKLAESVKKLNGMAEDEIKNSETVTVAA